VTPSRQQFMEHMLARFHEVVPDVTLVIAPQEPPPAILGLSLDQANRQSAAAMAAAVDLLRGLWLPATGGLPMPAAAATSWRQESGHPSAVLAIAHARHTGPVSGAAARTSAAGRQLAALGWATRRHDTHRQGCLRLLASRGPTLIEVTFWPRPGAYDVQIYQGPVLVGAAGADLIATGTQTIVLTAETA
jgi:hypothetical protein